MGTVLDNKSNLRISVSKDCFLTMRSLRHAILFKRKQLSSIIHLVSFEAIDDIRISFNRQWFGLGDRLLVGLVSEVAH